MPSTTRGYVLGAVRVVLGVAGLGVAAATILALVTLPPAPPNSEGFVRGLTYVFGVVIVVLALGAAGLGVALPSMLGTDDVLGFSAGQRLLLKGAAALVGGGFLLGLAVGFATELQYGFLLWLVIVVLAVLVVCVAVLWRLAAAVVRVLARIVAGAR